MSTGDLPTNMEGSTKKVKLSREHCLGVSFCCLVPGALLMLILLPLSFQYLEYYQYGLLKRRSSGAMRLKEVFGPGRYVNGPDFTFKTFQATAHHVVLRNVSVVSNDKLETLIDVEYVYLLKKDQLILLHNAYERQYRPVVEARAIDAIKNTAPNHTTADFFLKRAEVSNSLFLAVKERLQEMYCSVDVLFLQKATIPDQVSNRQLETAVQNEANAQEAFIAQAKLQRQETERQVNDINNKAALLITTAAANASKLVSNAHASARQLVEQAEYGGLQGMYTQLGLKDPAHKASLDYIRTLRDNAGVVWHLGYNTKVATFANEGAAAAAP